MRIIGIDPGTRYVGYGIIDYQGNAISLVDCGTINATKFDSYEKRLAFIFNELAIKISIAKPDEGAIEKAFVGKNVHSALRLGEGRGVAITALAVHGVSVAEYAPLLIKKAVLGKGTAHKSQVRAMVCVLLNINDDFLTDDTSDALAVAICHSHRRTDALRSY